jgi:lysozyme
MLPRKKSMMTLASLGLLAGAASCTSPAAPEQPRAEARAPAVSPPPARAEQAAAPAAAAPAAAAPAAQASASEAPAAKPQGRAQGIDISHYQPKVEWETVKSSVSFVFIKATDSTRGADPLFSSHWSGAKKVGLPRGAYHFFHPKHEVDEQVANFTRHLKPDPGELPPVVDVEEFRDEYQGFTCEQLAGMLQRFSQGVEKELGRKPMIYTNHQTWHESFCDHAYFTDHSLWLAQYSNHPEPKLPQGWSRWNFWQYTESGKVPGISSAVDQSHFNGTEEELKALLATK